MRRGETYFGPLHVILAELVPISEFLQASSDTDYFPEVCLVINGELYCIRSAIINMV
jgi:hypothetical protein